MDNGDGNKRKLSLEEVLWAIGSAIIAVGLIYLNILLS